MKQSQYFLQPAYTLCMRELIRFFRQKHRVIGALGQPIVFWLLMGYGFRASFKPAGAPLGVDYAEYFYAGVIAMILLFTAIFATVSIIEDRREGFLQSVLVAPVPRTAIVCGKTLGGAMIAVVHALAFLALAPFAGLSLSVGSVLMLAWVMFLVAFGLTALGFCLAWRMTSVQGFHSVMMLFLMPMWLLSGAFFPAHGAPAALQWIIKLNPLTYGVALLRYAFDMQAGAQFEGLPSFGLSLGVYLGFTALTVLLAARIAEQ